jgi:hypothetical protein
MSIAKKYLTAQRTIFFINKLKIRKNRLLTAAVN